MTKNEMLHTISALEEKLRIMRDVLADSRHGGERIQARGEEMQARLAGVLEEIARFRSFFEKTFDGVVLGSSLKTREFSNWRVEDSKEESEK